MPYGRKIMLVRTEHLDFCECPVLGLLGSMPPKASQPVSWSLPVFLLKHPWCWVLLSLN